MDDEKISKPKAHEVGMVLDALSVQELESRIVLLEGEIVRLRQAIEMRSATKRAADAVFNF